MNRRAWVSAGLVLAAAFSAGAARAGQGESKGSVRGPAVAGLFYPLVAERLAKAVDAHLAAAKAPPVGLVRGLIVPHAGYRYSGLTAAFAFNQIRGRAFKTVVVMGPSHYTAFAGASIPPVAAYRTPLGDVPVSAKAARLAKMPPFTSRPTCRVRRPAWWRRAPKELPPFGQDTPHTWEHSLEVQLPFLQRTLKGFSLVPIVFGQADEAKAAEALMRFLDDETLLVASSDLSHHEPYATAVKLDAACIRAICRMDFKAMPAQHACGKSPILTLMHVAKKKGWRPRLLDYRNSGDTAGTRSGVVGYAAIAFVAAEGKTEGEFTSKQRKVILALARKSLAAAVTGKDPPTVGPAVLKTRLMDRKGCFVTLTKGGRLRGCVGHIFPAKGLCQAIINNARSAAMRDKRFAPVKPEELTEIEVEVSVLTVPKPLSFSSPGELLSQLRPYVDGVVLRLGERQSTYLPQVWQQIPNKEMFLSNLSRKAGAEPGAWRGKGVTVLTYQAEVVHEND